MMVGMRARQKMYLIQLCHTLLGINCPSFVFLSLLVLYLVFLSLLLPGKAKGFFVRREMTDCGGCFGVGMCLIRFWRAVFGGLRTSIMRW